MKYIADLERIDGYVYLASAYSDPVYTMQILRYEIAKRAQSLLHDSGFVTYSPIVHWHPVAETYNLEKDSFTWSYHNLTMLHGADEVWVLMFPGWQDSKGIAMELEWAKNKEKPVRFIYFNDAQDTLLVLDDEKV